MTKYITLEEASKLIGKSIRTIRRHLDKLDDSVTVNVTKKQNNKLLISQDFVKTLTDVTVNVTDNVTLDTGKKYDVDDLKRQILRLEKKLDEKESELKLKEEKHIDDLKLFTSKVLYLEEEKSKDSSEAKSVIKKIEAEKNELLIQKAKLEERLVSEKSKISMTYFVAVILFVFLIVLFLMISLQVF
jgi:hypothetical protein